MANEPWKKGRPINWNCIDITITIKRIVAKTIITTKLMNQHIVPAKKRRKLDHLIPAKGNFKGFNSTTRFSDKFEWHPTEAWL